MYNGIFNYTNINIFSILRICIAIYGILVIAIKFIAFIVKRNRPILKQEENTIISEKIKIQQPTTLDLAAVNFSVIIILCLCAIVFFLVQYGYYKNINCQYNLTDYWNILLLYLLSISFIAPDIDTLFDTNFTNSIIFTKWFKTFEFIVLTLYLPITISLMIIC